MHTLTEQNMSGAYPSTITVPIPGEEHRAGGGIGTPITIEGADANGGLTYTAGVDGVRIRHLGGTSQTLGVSVVGNDITVQLGTDGGAVVTSTATDVKTAFDAVGAATALASVLVTGTGAGLAAMSPNSGAYVEISDGAAGSIYPALRDLQGRTSYLAEHAAAWGPPINFSCTNNQALSITLSLAGPGILKTTSTTYTPTVGTIVADTWYYVYAKVTAGAIAFEHGTTAPDAYLQYKTGSTTTRYVGAFRTYTDAFNGNADSVGIHPFRCVRGHYRYLYPVLVGSAKTSTSYADQAATIAVPPHCRLATIWAVLANGSGSQNFVAWRAKGIVEGGVALAQPQVYTSGTAGAGNGEVGLDSSNVFEYRIGSSSTSSVDLYVGAWDE